MARTYSFTKDKSNGANLGFEQKLWQSTDKLWRHMEPAEYKYVVLGPIFFKYISDAFEEKPPECSMKRVPLQDGDGYVAERIEHGSTPIVARSLIKQDPNFKSRTRN